MSARDLVTETIAERARLKEARRVASAAAHSRLLDIQREAERLKQAARDQDAAIMAGLLHEQQEFDARQDAFRKADKVRHEIERAAIKREQAIQAEAHRQENIRSFKEFAAMPCETIDDQHPLDVVGVRGHDVIMFAPDRHELLLHLGKDGASVCVFQFVRWFHFEVLKNRFYTLNDRGGLYQRPPTNRFVGFGKEVKWGRRNR